MQEIKYIYRADHGWVLRSESRVGQIFKTQSEAIANAQSTQPKSRQGRIVVFRSDGQFKVLGETAKKVERHPKMGRARSRQISAAVGRIVLDRLRASDEHGA